MQDLRNLKLYGNPEASIFGDLPDLAYIRARTMRIDPGRNRSKAASASLGAESAKEAAKK